MRSPVAKKHMADSVLGSRKLQLTVLAISLFLLINKVRKYSSDSSSISGTEGSFKS